MEPKQRQRFRQIGPLIVFVPFMFVALVLLYIAIKKIIDGDKEGVPALLFASLFCAALVAMIFLSRANQKKAEAAERKHQADPAPWLRRDDWAKGETAAKENESAGSLIIGVALFVAALIFGGIFINQFLQGMRVYSAPDFSQIIPFIFFGVAAVVGTTASVRAILRRKKFGKSVFKMSSVPGIIGGKLEGKIEIGTRLEPPAGFKLRLCCLNEMFRSSPSTLWQDEQRIRFDTAADDPTYSAIPVLFDIPRECFESDDSNPACKVVWWLEASAEAPGVNYLARFEVPVFKTQSVAQVQTE